MEGVDLKVIPVRSLGAAPYSASKSATTAMRSSSLSMP